MGRMTIQQVIDVIMAAIPGAPLKDTVDTYKAGDPTRPVSGIVTTFLATCRVIERAAELGANLIITHEPTFYNHRDEVEWLQGDPVYQAKRGLLDDNGIAVWRFHDHWHMHRPDGILTGVVRALGWEEYAAADKANLFSVPAMRVLDLVAILKEKLYIDMVRLVGDPDMICRQVALLEGAFTGQTQISALAQEDVDVVICGEVREWESCEYARDALHLGQRKALLAIGHANSEEAGMAWLVDWLRPRLPGVEITHVPALDPFRFI